MYGRWEPLLDGTFGDMRCVADPLARDTLLSHPWALLFGAFDGTEQRQLNLFHCHPAPSESGEEKVIGQRCRRGTDAPMYVGSYLILRSLLSSLELLGLVMLLSV